MKPHIETRKKARTEIYAIIFGPAKSANNKLRGQPPEDQRRKPHEFSFGGFKAACKQVVKLFEATSFTPARERELIRYLNDARPKGAKPFTHERDEDDVESDVLVAAGDEQVGRPVLVRGETRRALDGWGVS